MVLVTSTNPNDNEDSQGTKLLISKKLTTVCSGKRSRFSKPRPNLSISKRGDTNVPVCAGKTSKKSVEDCHEVLFHEDVNKKSYEKDTKVSADYDVIKKSVEKDTRVSADNDVIKKSVEKNTRVSADNDVIKKSVEKDTRVSADNDVIKKSVEKDTKVSADNDVIKKSVEKDTKVSPDKDTVVPDSEDIRHISVNTKYQKSVTAKNSHDDDISVISNLETEKLHSDEVISSTNGEKSTLKKNTEISSSTKNKSQLRSPESEKRSISNATTTLIDKSKYPHLTSILSKKRTEPRKQVQQKRRKKFKKGDAPPERSKMTMADLIYWNPARTNELQKSDVHNTSAVHTNETPNIHLVAEEESFDDAVDTEDNILDSVPKLVISEDGQINIDQSSLFVSRNIPQPISTEVVRKDDTTYSSFRKRPLTKHWTAKDTANFYRALSLVGADFSLMEQIFPNRTRRELKQKFKREEKFNIDLINKVLYESQTFDELTLNDFINQNSPVDDDVLIHEKDNGKSTKKQSSKKTKSTDDTCNSSTDNVEQEIAAKNKKTENNKKTKRKAKKLSDDEDIEILVTNYTNYNDIDDQNGSKRKIFTKKLPDDFISLDDVDVLEIWNEDETDNQDIFENESSSESQGNDNDTEIREKSDVQEAPIETACAILDKIMNGTENIDNQQNLKEETSNAVVTIPVVTLDDEEYVSVEYVKNNNTDIDLCMLSNVVAFEVVNTQTPPPKKKRKTSSLSPLKTRDCFLSPKVSVANYTNYTPV